LAHPLVARTRGRGLLQAIVLRRAVAADVVARALDAGFLVNAVAPDAVRLAPPLVLTEAQLDDFTGALPALLDAVDGR
ncbi:MAG: aminotransferase class III-fold pyridoxal phosphate-dependent enzyme, partial [Actinomycetota bacterium]